MKNKKVIVTAIVSILLLIGIIVVYILNKPKDYDYNLIKKFHYSFSGYGLESSFPVYEIECEKNACSAIIKPAGVEVDDKVTVDLSKSDMNKFVNICKKYKVNRWNGFKKSDKNVLDGSSFSFYITFSNNDELSASGYMKWPKDYDKVTSEITKLFENWYNQ